MLAGFHRMLEEFVVAEREREPSASPFVHHGAASYQNFPMHRLSFGQFLYRSYSTSPTAKAS